MKPFWGGFEKQAAEKQAMIPSLNPFSAVKAMVSGSRAANAVRQGVRTAKTFGKGALVGGATVAGGTAIHNAMTNPSGMQQIQ